MMEIDERIIDDFEKKVVAHPEVWLFDKGKYGIGIFKWRWGVCIYFEICIEVVVWFGFVLKSWDDN